MWPLLVLALVLPSTLALQACSSQAIGSTYSAFTPPVNGLIVEGNTGLQCTTPLNPFDVYGGAAFGTCACSAAAPTNGVSMSGNLWVGTCSNVTDAAITASVASSTKVVLAGVSTNIASTSTGPTATLYQNAAAKAVNLTGTRIGSWSMGGSKDTSNTLITTASITAVTTEVWNSTATGTDVIVEATAPGNSTKAEVVRFTGAGTVRLTQKTTTQITAMVSPANGEIAYDSTVSQFKGRVGGAWLPYFTGGFQVYADQKTSGTGGGTSVAAVWTQIRTLNTVLTGNLDGVYTSLSNNNVTIQPGTYLIEANAPTYSVLRHMLRLYSVTGAAVTSLGGSEYAANTVSNRSFLSCYVTLTSATTYRLEHYTASAVATQGLGVEASIASTSETYAVIMITKIA